MILGGTLFHTITYIPTWRLINIIGSKKGPANVAVSPPWLDQSINQYNEINPSKVQLQ